MTTIVWAGLLLAAAGGAAAAPSTAPVEHRTRIDHHSGAVDATYRGDVAITHRQVGAAGPGGRASTLGCAWRADIAVVRDARHASGSLFTRSMERRGAIEGRRAGWCSTQRAAIAEEVARRSDELHGHLIDVAQEDHPLLHGEVDRAHGNARSG